jgi:copper(I)-binding protein
MKLRPLVLAPALVLALALPACPAVADSVLALDHGSVWLTHKNGQNTQGFVQIHNTGDAPDTLTAVKCTIADSTVLVDAKGNPLPSLDIAAGQTVTLSGAGPHLLINGARYKIEKDGILPCAFTFASSGDILGYLNAVPQPRS